jgi:hypothetical protein
VQTEPTETIPPEVDFLLEDYGSIILLRPVTAVACQWVDTNIGKDNGSSIPALVLITFHVSHPPQGEDGRLGCRFVTLSFFSKTFLLETT